MQDLHLRPCTSKLHKAVRIVVVYVLSFTTTGKIFSTLAFTLPWEDRNRPLCEAATRRNLSSVFPGHACALLSTLTNYCGEAMSSWRGIDDSGVALTLQSLWPWMKTAQVKSSCTTSECVITMGWLEEPCTVEVCYHLAGTGHSTAVSCTCGAMKHAAASV